MIYGLTDSIWLGVCHVVVVVLVVVVVDGCDDVVVVASLLAAALAFLLRLQPADGNCCSRNNANARIDVADHKLDYKPTKDKQRIDEKT